MRRWALIYWLCLVGTLLFYNTNSESFSVVSRSQFGLAPLLKLFGPPGIPTAPSSAQMETLTCACGKSYSSDSHFERHQNTCEYLLDASHRSWELADSRAKKKMKMTPRFAPSSGAGISRTNKGRKGMDRKGRHDVATANINNASSSNNRYESLPVDDPMVSNGIPSPHVV